MILLEAAHSPAQAIDGAHFSNQQILAEIEGLLSHEVAAGEAA